MLGGNHSREQPIVIIALEASGVYGLRWRPKVPLRDPSRRARFWFLIFSQLLSFGGALEVPEAVLFLPRVPERRFIVSYPVPAAHFIQRL